MKKVRFIWSTRNPISRKKIEERLFCVHHPKDGSPMWIKVDDRDLELMRECENRGFIKIQSIE